MKRINKINKKIDKTSKNNLQINMLKKEINKNNPIIKYENILEKNKNFSKLILNEWEVLFDEGDIDNNLYFILNWELSIEKYTTSEHNETKELAKISSWNFLGEWSLKRTEKKEVKVKATKNTTLLKINAKKWFENFIKQEPKIGLDILIKIIDTSNIRLLESNKKLTTILKMSEQISQIDEYNIKNIFKLIDSFSKVIWLDYILYLERNPIMKNYMTIKYDTRKIWKLQDNIVDLWDKQLELSNITKTWIKTSKYNTIEELRNWNKILWYLVLWKKDSPFNDTDIRSIKPIVNSLAWVIKQKEYNEEQKNKEYAENI